MSVQPQASTSERPRRPIACLHCRRQKLKCDGQPGRPCMRCIEEDVECVIRPRVNAAIAASDLRWQQMVENRLQALGDDIAELRRENKRPRSYDAGDSQTVASKQPRLITDGLHPDSSTHVSARIILPDHLLRLKDALVPSFDVLHGNRAASVSVEEATLLWEFFYTDLAIYHGFVAHVEPSTPSPLLLASIAAASSSRAVETLSQHAKEWLDLFHSTAAGLLVENQERGWDDIVALCIARTWFWKATSASSGLIYGQFLAILSPATADTRCRRVWDFMRNTIVSHSALDLSPQIIPDIPPSILPPRRPVHVLYSALSELFDILGVMSQSLTSFINAVDLAMNDFQCDRINAPYAEIALLRSSRTELDRWLERSLVAVSLAEAQAHHSHTFISDLITVYHRAAVLVVSAYIVQPRPVDAEVVTKAGKEILSLVVTVWSQNLTRWPTFLLTVAVMAAIAVPLDDPLVARSIALFDTSSPRFDTACARLYQHLQDKLRQYSDTQGLPGSPLNLLGQSSTDIDVSLPVSLTPQLDPFLYTGSDSLWQNIGDVWDVFATVP